MNLTTDDQPKQQKLSGLGTRQRALSLPSSAKLPVEPLNRIGGAKRFPLAVGKTVECQQLFSSLFQAHHYFGNEFFPLHNKLPISFSPFLTGLCVDDPVVIALHFLQSMPGCVPLRSPHFPPAAALPLPPSLFLPPRRSQPFVPTDDHKPRPPKPSINQPLHKPAPAFTRLTLQELQVQHHLLPVRFNGQGHQHRSSDHLGGDPHPKRYSIQKTPPHRLFFQRPLAPIGKQALKTPHNPRDRTLRKRRATQKRRKGSPYSPPVRSAEVTAQKRTIDRPSTPLITLDESTLPFLLLLTLPQPCPGQLDLRRSQSRADPSLPLAVTIPPSLTVALVAPRCQNLS